MKREITINNITFSIDLDKQQGYPTGLYNSNNGDYADIGDGKDPAEPFINAVDIDWNGAQVAGQTVNTTGHLLNLLSVAIEANGAVEDTYYVWFTGQNDSGEGEGHTGYVGTVTAENIANMTLHNTITDAKASIEAYADHEMSMAIDKEFDSDIPDPDTQKTRKEMLAALGFTWTTVGGVISDFELERRIYQLKVTRTDGQISSGVSVEHTKHSIKYHLESGIRDKFFISIAQVAGITINSGYNGDFKFVNGHAEFTLPAFDTDDTVSGMIGWTTNKNIADGYTNGAVKDTEAKNPQNGFLHNTTNKEEITVTSDELQAKGHPIFKDGSVTNTNIVVYPLVKYKSITTT